MCKLTPCRKLPLTTAVVAALCILAGCKARDMGVPTADHTADFVDQSWVAATKSCWPDLEHGGYTLAGIKHNLADPLRFRSTFPSYAAQSEASIRGLVTKPLMTAPPPDGSVLNNSRTPVLTRGQAAAGASAQQGLAPGGNGFAPPDALCALHSGTPVGFK